MSMGIPLISSQQQVQVIVIVCVWDRVEQRHREGGIGLQDGRH